MPTSFAQLHTSKLFKTRTVSNVVTPAKNNQKKPSPAQIQTRIKEQKQNSVIARGRVSAYLQLTSRTEAKDHVRRQRIYEFQKQRPVVPVIRYRSQFYETCRSANDKLQTLPRPRNFKICILCKRTTFQPIQTSLLAKIQENSVSIRANLPTLACLLTVLAPALLVCNKTSYQHFMLNLIAKKNSEIRRQLK